MAGLATLGYLLFRNSAEEVILSSEQQVLHANEIVEIKFVSFIEAVRRDIIHLSLSPYLNDYLSGFNNKKNGLLSGEYLALLNSKPDYAQIRLIGIENGGKELIRAERLGNITFLVTGDSLQQKGNRDYFIETVQFPKDSIFFSQIDLNKEYGKITQPPIPTLRAASPIYKDNKIFGAVIINVNLQNLFQELAILAGPKFDLKIANQDGHFLIHPDPEKTFTFEFNYPAQFQGDFGISLDEALKAIMPQKISLIKENGYLYSFQRLHYPKNEYKLYAAIGSDEKEILHSFYQLRRKSLTITFGLALLILLAAFGYMRRQAKELKGITETMTSFPKNLTPTKLPITRNDEIGQLAKSFEEMSAIISGNMAALKNAKEEVDQAIKEKDAFLENMSHEIRNPIHSIIGMTHLLEKNNPGRHQQAFIEALKFNSKNLLSLVNDILDFKKLSIGEISIHPEWFSLPLFIHEISNSHKFNAVAKKIKLQEDIDPELNHHIVFFDPVRLTQVVNNLIINAIKFTNYDGAVNINVGIMEKSEEGFKIRFSVRDNGIGIEENTVHKIVERYYTKNEIKSDIAPEGAGLGLPIVIQLLQLFSSKLIIESKPGAGSHFYFDLLTPVKSQSNTDAESSTQIPVNVLEDVNLLVIDDDEQVLFLYEHLFEQQVKSLRKLSNIGEIDFLANNKFDVIISDIHFDQNNLFSFKEGIKNLMGENGFLFIVSGIGFEPEKLEQLPQFKRAFQKPVNPDTFLNSIAYDISAQCFGVPDVSNILTDYDNDQRKFVKAIDILVNEWEKMLSQIEMAIVNKDKDKYIALRHKIITAVRRLQLIYFEEILHKPFQKEKEEMGLSAGFASQIKKMMSFYIWYLKNKVKKEF